MKIVAAEHTYPLVREAYLNGDSDSWLRALRRLPKSVVVHIFAVEVNNETRVKMGLPELQEDQEAIVDNIHYHFSCVSDGVVHRIGKAIRELNPNVVYFNSHPDYVEQMLFDSDYSAYTILRLHGETKRLLSKDSTLMVDALILPWDYQMSDVGPCVGVQDLRSLPFGVDMKFFKTEAVERDIDFVSFTSQPLKNQYCVRAVFDVLRARGFKCEIVYGLSKAKLRSVYQRGRVFFFPSQTEGVSRSLSEATACGMIPVVDVDVPSTSIHSLMLHGYGVKTRSILNQAGTQVVELGVSADDIAADLIDIREWEQDMTMIPFRQSLLNRYFNIEKEIDTLLGVFDKALCQS